jgi:regulator of sirC expression with transglutaminase-like and TPR domain
MHAEAADDCSRIIRLIPDDADAYRDRAICFYNLRRYNEAWNDLETCKRLGGLPNPEFIMMLARERASGDLKPAVPGF